MYTSNLASLDLQVLPMPVLMSRLVPQLRHASVLRVPVWAVMWYLRRLSEGGGVGVVMVGLEDERRNWREVAGW